MTSISKTLPLVGIAALTVVGWLVSFSLAIADEIDLTQFDLSPEAPQGYWGVGHGQYHQQYMKMHNKLGTHCCNEGDCSPTQAYYDADRDQWVALVNGQPQWITADRHVKDAYGLVGYAHVCTAKRSGKIWCFIPPYTPG